MAKTEKTPPTNRAIFLSIEKIKNGFVIIEPAGIKTWKATINGVVKHLEEAFGVSMIEVHHSDTTESTVLSILKTEKTIPQKKQAE